MFYACKAYFVPYTVFCLHLLQSYCVVSRVVVLFLLQQQSFKPKVFSDANPAANQSMPQASPFGVYRVKELGVVTFTKPTTQSIQLTKKIQTAFI